MVGLNGLHFVSWGEGDGSGAHLSLGYRMRNGLLKLLWGLIGKEVYFEGSDPRGVVGARGSLLRCRPLNWRLGF